MKAYVSQYMLCFDVAAMNVAATKGWRLHAVTPSVGYLLVKTVQMEIED